MKSRFRRMTALAAAVAMVSAAVIPGFTSNAQDEGLAAAKEAALAAASSVEETVEASAAAEEPVETYDTSVTFSDVRLGDWYYEAVMFAAENGIMSGYSDSWKFGPADSLTREQFATVLYRMSGSPEIEYQQQFPDVEAGMYYSEAITWAYENSIIAGYTDTRKFGVGDYITREQIATMLCRYDIKNGKDADNSGVLYMYPDAGSVSEYAQYGMEYAVFKGYIRGDKGHLKPYSATNRAEIATMLMRYLAEDKPVDVQASVQQLVNYVKTYGEIVEGYKAIYVEYPLDAGSMTVFISYMENENCLEFFANIKNITNVVFYYDITSMTVDPGRIIVDYYDETEEPVYFLAIGTLDMETYGINSEIPFQVQQSESNFSTENYGFAAQLSNVYAYTAMVGWRGLLAMAEPALGLRDLGFASYANLF